MTLRSQEEEKRYSDFIKNDYDYSCIFCSGEKRIKKYKYWLIRQQDFPYNIIASKHHLLATIAHKHDENELSKEEYKEYLEIKEELKDKYDLILLNMPKSRSIPAHLHYHLIKLVK